MSLMNNKKNITQVLVTFFILLSASTFIPTTEGAKITDEGINEEKLDLIMGNLLRKCKKYFDNEKINPLEYINQESTLELEEGQSSEFNEFKDIYNRFSRFSLKWLGISWRDWMDIVSPTIVVMMIIFDFVLMTIAAVCMMSGYDAAAYLALIGLIVADVGVLGYLCSVYILAWKLSVFSVKLSLYFEDSNGNPITNANVSGQNINDDGTFGEFTLYPDDSRPGWYSTLPVVEYTDEHPPPGGSWNITIQYNETVYYRDTPYLGNGCFFADTYTLP